MGWSNDIPNPFVVGGNGVSGKIIILDINGNILATLDENGIDVVSPGFAGQHTVLGRDPNTGAPGLFIYNGVDPDPSFLRIGTGSPNRLTLGTPTSSVDLGSTFLFIGVDSFGDAPLISMDDSGIAGAPKISLIPESANTFGLYLHTSGRWAELGFQGAQSGAAVSCVDGKIVSTSTDTVNNTVGTEVTVSTANCQNTPQISGHAYRAFVQVSLAGAVAANRARYRLWDGTPGLGTQLGNQGPTFKCNANVNQFEDVQMIFCWTASSTQTISNVNLGFEFLAGTTSVTTRIQSSFNFTIDDLGPASRLSGF